MLFLLKRRWQGGLAGLLVLTALGLVMRSVLPDVPPLGFSAEALLLGAAVGAGALASDAVIHLLLLVLLGDRYGWRHRQLVEVFRGQTFAAMATGALMAGVGEELVFRGLGSSPLYLVGGAVAFGLLHHVRRDLWPFTVWSVYQGLLFAAALYGTGALGVTMTAHFLHDLAGFLLFAHVRRGTAVGGPRARVTGQGLPRADG
jgi:membrane protease YdiL (CAAX protease family)